MKLVRFLSGAAVLALAGLQAGCGDPAHQQRIAHCAEGLRFTQQTLQHLESKRPSDLAMTAGVIRDRHELDQEHFRDDLDAVDQRFHGEFESWNEKQPAMRRDADRLLRGNPESIRDTVPLILW